MQKSATTPASSSPSSAAVPGTPATSKSSTFTGSSIHCRRRREDSLIVSTRYVYTCSDQRLLTSSPTQVWSPAAWSCSYEEQEHGSGTCDCVSAAGLKSLAAFCISLNSRPIRGPARQTDRASNRFPPPVRHRPTD